MRQTLFHITLALAFALLTGGGSAQTTDSAARADAPSTAPVIHDPRALEWLGKVESRHETIQRIHAEFDQIKWSALFLERIDSTGEIKVIKPDKLYIEYDPALFTWVVDDIYWVYNPEIRQVDKIYLGRGDRKTQRVNRMLLGFGTSVEELKRHFRISLIEETDTKVGIRFKPLDDVKDRLFNSCDLYLSLEEIRPLWFYIVDDSDDETTVTIKDVTWNPEIDPEVFKLDFPNNAEIIERN